MSALYGLVLAGGRSTRMGSDKGALNFHGTDQTHHLAGLLAPYAGDVFVSVRAEQLGAPYLEGLKPVTDHYGCPSPLNGVVSAMRLKPGASWLVAAVDMPNVTPAAIESLVAERDAKAVATCFESPVKGGPDPLLALWEGHAFAALETLIEKSAEHICPRGVLKQMGAHILKNRIAPEVLGNVNTPEERDLLLKRTS